MAVGDAHVFPGFLMPVLTQISFQSDRLLFSHASAEVRGENTPERNFASTGSRTYNHQVTSPTSSPLSQPGWARKKMGLNHLQTVSIKPVGYLSIFLHKHSFCNHFDSCNDYLFFPQPYRFFKIYYLFKSRTA